MLLPILGIGWYVSVPGLEGFLHVDEEQREAGRARLGVGGRDRSGDRDHPVGSVDPRDPDLLALDEEVIAVAAGVRGDRQRIAAGIRLGQRHAELGVARGEARKDLLLLLVRAVSGDRHGAEARRQDVEERPLRCSGGGERLVGDGELEQALAAAAVLLGHGQAEPATFAEGSPRLVGESVLLLQAGPVGVVEAGHGSEHAFAYGDGSVGKGEIHGGPFEHGKRGMIELRYGVAGQAWCVLGAALLNLGGLRGAPRVGR